MKPSISILSIAAIVLAGTIASSHAQNATTDPVGFVTVNITAGSGTAKKTTLFSLPLLDTIAILGQDTGMITGVSPTSISNSSAGWTSGELSQAATPFLIQITSGNAEGRMFLISSSNPNTSTTVNISSVDATQIDLTSLGIALGTDTYKIYACDTLSSFFGNPASSGILGGTSANAADSVILVSNGAASTFYYNTTSNRWTKSAFGNPDATNEPLLPYYGIQFARLANTSLSFTITGAVPTESRKVAVKSSGTTLLSQYWPSDSTIASLGLQSLPGWLSGANANSADTIVLTENGNASTYFYDGSNWKKSAFGSPISDDVVIPVGSSIRITKKGSESGYTTLSQNAPYNL